jgi:carbon-monoxide dehydrogenase medium subunit
MVALGASLTATGPAGERQIDAAAFFVDIFTTDLQAGELLTSITVPGYGAGTGGAYVKHRHPASSYAVVGAAALVEVSGGKCTRVRLVIGGVQGIPVHAEAAERALTGQPPAEASVFRAAEKVPEALTEPNGDLYASAEYRVHLSTVLARRALAKAVERAKGQAG